MILRQAQINGLPDTIKQYLVNYNHWSTADAYQDPSIIPEEEFKRVLKDYEAKHLTAMQKHKSRGRTRSPERSSRRESRNTSSRRRRSRPSDSRDDKRSKRSRTKWCNYCAKAGKEDRICRTHNEEDCRFKKKESERKPPSSSRKSSYKSRDKEKRESRFQDRGDSSEWSRSPSPRRSRSPSPSPYARSEDELSDETREVNMARRQRWAKGDWPKHQKFSKNSGEPILSKNQRRKRNKVFNREARAALAAREASEPVFLCTTDEEANADSANSDCSICYDRYGNRHTESEEEDEKRYRRERRALLRKQGKYQSKRNRKKDKDPDSGHDSPRSNE